MRSAVAEDPFFLPTQRSSPVRLIKVARRLLNVVLFVTIKCNCRGRRERARARARGQSARCANSTSEQRGPAAIFSPLARRRIRVRRFASRMCRPLTRALSCGCAGRIVGQTRIFAPAPVASMQFYAHRPNRSPQEFLPACALHARRNGGFPNRDEGSRVEDAGTYNRSTAMGMNAKLKLRKRSREPQTRVRYLIAR